MRQVILILIISMALVGCSTTLAVNRTALQDVALRSDTGDLYLYGRGSLNDPVKLAIFDIADDEFSFHLMAPESMYHVIRGMESAEAVSVAEDFVGSPGTCADSVRANSILDDNGRVIGYEFRAIYDIPLQGIVDPLISSYWMQTTDSVGINVSLADPNTGAIRCSRG